MGSFLTNRDQYQCLVIPDERWQAWAAQSVASPDGGRAEVTTSSNLHLEPVDLDTGAPTGVVTTCVRSGMPAPTDGNQAGAYKVTHTDGTVYGLDECLELSGVSKALDAFAYKWVSLSVDHDHGLAIVGVNTANNEIQMFYHANDATNPTKVVARLSAGLTSEYAHPAAHAIGDKATRVWWVDQGTTLQDGPVRVGVSTYDNGTVTRDGNDVLGDGLELVQAGSSSLGDIRHVTGTAVGVRGDEVLLLLAVDYASGSTARTNARSTLRQYASIDGGLSFRFIGELNDASADDNATQPVVIANDAGYLVMYQGWDGSQVRVYRRTIGSAYAPLTGSDAEDIGNLTNGSVGSGILSTNDRLKGWQDHRGHVFVMAGEDSYNYSTDGGISWGNARSFHLSQGSTDDLQAWDVAYHRGQAVLAVDRTTNGISTDNSLTLLSLGGWTSQNWQPHPDGKPDIERHRWSQVYIPCGGVQRLSTVSIAGSGYGQTFVGGVQRVTSTTNTNKLTATVLIGAGSGTDGADEPAAFEVSGTTAADATTTGLANVEFPLTYDLRVGDGSSCYGMRVVQDGDSLILYEVTGASTYTSRSTVVLPTKAGGHRITVRMLLEGGKGAVWYREDDTTDESKATPPLRAWTKMGSTLTLTDIGAYSSSLQIIHRMASGDTCDIHYWAVRGTNNTGYNLTPILEGTDVVRGGEYAYRPLWLADDIAVRSLGGAAAVGDDHNVLAAYDNGLEAALTTDPRIGFVEATGITSDLKLAYQGPQPEAATIPPGGALAVVLIGANFASFDVETYDGSTWTTAATIDERLDVAWLNEDMVIRPDPANNTAGPLVREGEFVGANWVFDTTSSTTQTPRVIEAAIGGKWTEDNWPPQLHIKREDTMSTGHGGSGTNGAIVPASVAVIIETPSAIEGVRIVVSNAARQQVGGQLKVGRVVLGRVLPHVAPYSWGRVVAVETGATLTEMRDRTTRRVVDAQPRRVVDVAWADGLPTIGATRDVDDPDYASLFDGTLAQAANNHTAFEVFGILTHLNGGKPVVYLPRVETTTGTSISMARRDLIVYGRLEGEPRWEVVLGDEDVDEVVRGLGFTIRELI